MTIITYYTLKFSIYPSVYPTYAATPNVKITLYDAVFYWFQTVREIEMYVTVLYLIFGKAFKNYKICF